MIVLALVFVLAVPNLADAAGRVFYDGSEAGNTDLWPLRDPVTVGNRDKCTSVSVAEDGGSAPYAGSRMIRCRFTFEGDDAAAYETLRLDMGPLYTNEFLIRTKFRRSATWQLTGALNSTDKSQKILRFFETPGSAYHDLFEGTGHSDAGTPASNNSNVGNTPDGPTYLPTYWAGDHPSDHTNESTGWHEIAYYINTSTQVIKVWHDGTLIRNNTGLDFGGERWTDFYLTSNGNSMSIDGYTYYDEFEVYSDTGTGGIGSMSDGTITQGGGGGGSSTGGSMDVKDHSRDLILVRGR